MKRLTSIVLVFMMTICLITPVLSVTSNRIDSDSKISAEAKVYSKATLDDQFADDGVLVVLSNKASLQFQEFKSSDFSEIGCIAVTDYSSVFGEKIRAQVDILSKATASTRELQSVDTAKIQGYNQVLYLRLSNTGKQNVLDAIKKLMLREDVIYAGPDYIYSVEPTAIGPDNPQNAGAYDKIQLEDAHGITEGSSDVLVGVMDSGIDVSHEDLTGRVNTGLSRYFMNGAAYVGGLTDDRGHGTLVAGIIAGRRNNTNGICGVAPNIKLVSLDVMTGSTTCSSNVIAAIVYAEQKNIQILNFSAGITEFDSDVSVEATIHNYSGVFVCAAGNGYKNLDGSPSYPASYNTSIDNMIVVGASNCFDGMWVEYDSNLCVFIGSNYGSTVDVFAPGVNIRSTATDQCTLYDGTYAIESGTSFAAPFVTGVAALLLSVNPSLTPQQIIARIILNSDRISMLINQTEQEVCRLNAYKSLLNATHLWAYTSKNLTQHTKACGCGESSLEYHTWIAVGTKYRCGSCGYITNALPGDFQNLGKGKTDSQACNHQ